MNQSIQRHGGKVEYLTWHGFCMPDLEFHWIDVFADEIFHGNQLAVFTNAEKITEKQMQDIAREMHLSETVFITGEEDRGKGDPATRIRIFTTMEELPFAGHPTLGTAFLINRLTGRRRILLSMKVGAISVNMDNTKDGVYGEMLQNNPEFGEVHDRQSLSRIFGVGEEDLDATLPIQTVSTGNPFIIVPFRKLSVLQGVTVDYRAMSQYLQGSDARFIYAVSSETVNPVAKLHARMLFYDGEDPATGSAAGPAAAWMLKYGLLKPGEKAWIEQGLEVRRPSRIFVSGSMEGGRIHGIRVGGYSRYVGRGTLKLEERGNSQ